MAGAVVRAWRTATTLGTAMVEPSQVRAIMGANRFYLLSAVVAVPWMVILAAFPSPRPPAPFATHALMIITWIACLWLSSRGLALLGAVLGLVMPVAQYTYLAHQFGRDAGFQLLLLAIPSVAFVIAHRRKAIMRAAFSLLVGVLLVWIYLAPAFSDPAIDASRGVDHALAVGNIVSVLLLLNLLAYYNDVFLRRERERADSLLVEAQAAADTDALTGALNRRGAGPLLQAAARAGDYAVVLVDVDRFKSVNDALGHAAGDVVLAGVARTLREVVGERGQVARWGGEEFLLLLRSASVGDARAVAEEVRREVDRDDARVPGEPVVTVSAGVAFARSGTTADRAIGAADACLYEAKASGRNLVVAREIGPPGG